ncbi:CNP1-like family protein [Chitinilyticum litopenaei]|uniref:CNP1-like family protein n=1 Tax=Chitinilyticum litopenaei TaxID=1121276 RepID=UPI0003FE20BA|nr:CNP1-like family protein [Chitinilyticum litopenaei]
MRLPCLASLLAAALTAASITPALADESRNPTGAEIERSEKGLFRSWMETGRAAPNEGSFSQPELAGLKDWAKIRMPHAKTYDFLIALDSISIGKSDDIVRYVVMAEARESKVRNVLFEGIDCISAQYRSYAFGRPDGSWAENSSGNWKLITANTHNAWQAVLVDEFCQLGGPYKLATIIDNLSSERVANECLDCATKRTNR